MEEGRVLPRREMEKRFRKKEPDSPCNWGDRVFMPVKEIKNGILLGSIIYQSSKMRLDPYHLNFIDID